MHKRMILALAATAAVLTSTSPSHCAHIISADWTSTSEGTIGSIGVELSGLSSPFLMVDSGQNFPLPDWNPPLTDVDRIQYGASNDWTATFSTSVSDLLVYVDNWRGASNSTDDPPVNYTFDQPFTILSGLTDASVTGNTLTLDDDFGFFFNGILQFSGPLNSLSVSSDAPDESGQAMTFALPVPEPSTASLIGSGTVFMLCGCLRIRRRS